MKIEVTRSKFPYVDSNFIKICWHSSKRAPISFGILRDLTMRRPIQSGFSWYHIHFRRNAPTDAIIAGWILSHCPFNKTQISPAIMDLKRITEIRIYILMCIMLNIHYTFNPVFHDRLPNSNFNSLAQSSILCGTKFIYNFAFGWSSSSCEAFMASLWEIRTFEYSNINCMDIWPGNVWYPQIARFMGPTWGPLGDNRTQVGPMNIVIKDLVSCYMGQQIVNDYVI